MPLLFILLDATRREPIKCGADERRRVLFILPFQMSQQYKSVKQGNCYI